MVNLGSTSKFTQGLYVDLDSLFDTRFAVLEEVNPMIAIDNLVNNKWQSRISDDPIGLPKVDFDTLYALRTVETLAKASQTEVIDLMKHWVSDVIKQALASPTTITIHLYVNVFPYTLTADEAKEIGAQLQAFFPPDVLFTMINVNIKDLTPALIKRYFSGMFMYDYHLWKEHHAKAGNFKDVKIPDVALYTPAIFHGEKPSEETLREYSEKKIDVFKEWEILSGPIVGIEFVPIQLFSTLLPPSLFADASRIEPFLKSKRNLKQEQPFKLHGI